MTLTMVMILGGPVGRENHGIVEKAKEKARETIPDKWVR
jgi:hypothetical protein